jgi:succinate dehydrogenase / fumarate reductase cytochrome b subunit
MKAQNNRPLSPHLQIYRLPLSAILSITHRASGVILSIAALVIVWVLSAAASDADSYATAYSHLASWYGQIFLIGVTFSLYLHFCNGIRHLFWDVGMGFELETADKTAKMVIAGAIILTVATWLTALNAG